MLIRTQVAGACILPLCMAEISAGRRVPASHLAKGTETHDPLMPPRVKGSILWHSAYAVPPLRGEITHGHMAT